VISQHVFIQKPCISGRDTGVHNQLRYVPRSIGTDEAYVRVVRKVSGGGIFRVEERVVTIGVCTTKVLEESRSEYMDGDGQPLGSWGLALPMTRWMLKEEAGGGGAGLYVCGVRVRKVPLAPLAAHLAPLAPLAPLKTAPRSPRYLAPLATSLTSLPSLPRSPRAARFRSPRYLAPLATSLPSLPSLPRSPRYLAPLATSLPSLTLLTPKPFLPPLLVLLRNPTRC
jgi:hypothetical protein